MTIGTDAAIKQAFSSVKQDITELRRGVNKNILRLDSLAGSLSTATTKEEFYSFIDKLGGKLDQHERTFADRQALEQQFRRISEQMSSLKAQIQQREKLTGDLLEIHRVRTDLAKLQGSAVQSKAFREEMRGVDRELDTLRRQLGREATLQKYQTDLRELRTQLALLKKETVTFKQVSEADQTIHGTLAEHKAALTGLQDTASQLLSETNRITPLQEQLGSVEAGLRKLEASHQRLDNHALAKPELEHALRDLRNRMDTLAATVERSLVEADLSELASRKQLQDLAKELKQELASEHKLAKLQDTVKDVQRSMSELASLRSRIDALSASLTKTEKNEDLAALRADFEAFQRQSVAESELHELREDFKALEQTVAATRHEHKSQSKGFAGTDDLKNVRQDVKYLMDNMANTQDLKQQASSFDSSLDMLRADLNALSKSLHASTPAVVPPRKPAAAWWRVPLHVLVDFFTEDERVPPQKTSKATAKPKKETKKKDNGGHGLYIAGGIVLLLALLGGIYYFSQADSSPVVPDASPVDDAADAASMDAPDADNHSAANTSSLGDIPVDEHASSDDAMAAAPAVNDTDNATTAAVNTTLSVVIEDAVLNATLISVDVLPADGADAPSAEARAAESGLFTRYTPQFVAIVVVILAFLVLYAWRKAPAEAAAKPKPKAPEPIKEHDNDDVVDLQTFFEEKKKGKKK